MPELESLQQRGVKLFNQLLEAESRGNRVLTENSQQAFSWFNLDDAEQATAFAFRLGAIAHGADDELAGLEAVLETAEHESITGDTAMVRQALSMFVTHNQSGRKLIKPRTVNGAPNLFVRSPERRRSARLQISEGGDSPQLDYWREDALANEHHEHWHQVYPFSGIPVRDFDQWVAQTSIDQMVDILDTVSPNPNWRAQLEAASSTQIASFFATNFTPQLVRQLPNHLRGLLSRSNDRHGELFIYMHAQMLARYDAELLSHGLQRVQPFGPAEWGNAIASGHNPIGLPFNRRLPGRSLSTEGQLLLNELNDAIEFAIGNDAAQQSDGSSIALEPVLVGEIIEAAAPWTTTIDTQIYRGLHNIGHGFLASLASPGGGGVMNSPVVAIRDPIFWRWHKHIDDLAAGWQEQQSPYPLDDQPNIIIRKAATTDGAGANWLSPDIALVHSDALPTDVDPETVGEDWFGGANWDTPVGTISGPATAAVTDELTTMMVDRQTPAGPAPFLSHEPFAWFLRLENPASQAIDITVRIFLAPVALEDDRRAWIEMDKFHINLAASQRRVVYRADTESSVIKRPAERSPDEISDLASGDGELSYCDCGWPWTLLLPRGNAQGMPYRLLVMCTDWSIDRVAEPEQCGSMSFCGATDRYPDSRDMGYPFCRPFAQPIADVFGSLVACAGRSLTIRHTS